MDGHLAALLGGADADLLAVISILSLSGMRLDELRRLRVAHCGRGSFRNAECAANLGPREVPVHSALAGTVLRLTRGRAGDAFLIGDGAHFGRAPSLTERRFDACRAAVGMAGPSLSIHGLRRWFVRTALDAEQSPDVVAAVIGHFRPGDAQPKPTWGQRCACVEAVQLPQATP
jgi:integrase